MNTPDDLKKLEVMLGGLKPSGRLDRDRLMFEAGRAAARRAARPWQGAAALLAAALVGALAWPGPIAEPPQVVDAGARGSAERQQNQIAAQEVESEASSDLGPERSTFNAQRSTSSEISGVRIAGRQPVDPMTNPIYLRQLVLEHGVEALPSSRSAGGAADNSRPSDPSDWREWRRYLEDVL